MDTLDALGFDRLSKTDIFTPVKITQDMVNLLPEEVFHPDFKFLDIACKSGRFLVTLKDRLMESPTMIKIFPDKKDRLNHILNNQLFGLATSSTAKIIFSSQIEIEARSFLSWIDTKFVRFFLAINISKLSNIMCDNFFRFVPAPPSGKFDHIYTDQELYEAFNLPQKYIDVIEAVIKKRK